MLAGQRVAIYPHTLIYSDIFGADASDSQTIRDPFSMSEILKFEVR